MIKCAFADNMIVLRKQRKLIMATCTTHKCVDHVFCCFSVVVGGRPLAVADQPAHDAMLRCGLVWLLLSVEAFLTTPTYWW